MAEYYPVYLNIENERCYVIGGGEVAERKVKSLLQRGARVIIISPDVTDELSNLVAGQKITHIKDSFQEKYLEEARLVIGATNDSKVNTEIYHAAQKKNILVNIVDSPAFCDFIVPSVVERGDLMIAISTSGKSPALAKKIRKEMEERYGKEYAEFLSIMGEVREKLLLTVKDQKKREKIFDNLVNSDIMSLLKEGKKEKIDSLLNEFLKNSDNQEI